MSERVLLITPLHNEAGHVERLIRSMAAQVRPPDLWVLADDGSTDGTADVAQRLVELAPFARIVRVTQPADGARDRLADALEARAFNWALHRCDAATFTHVGKVDADIELPPRYLADVLDRLRADPALGIAGGCIEEPVGRNGAWRLVRIPPEHVHGALKLYTRACFAAIGGMPERLGWDTIDETYARMHGFGTRSFVDVRARHHRPAGTSQGVVRGRARAGRCAYVARHGWAWVLLRSTRMATRHPIGVSGAAFLYGYAAAWAARASKVEDEDFRRFARAELRRRVRRELGRRLHA